MVDGSALLTSFIYGLRARGAWQDERGANLLDGGAPFYDTYATADGKYVAVGALEPQFYAALLAGLGLDRRRPARPARRGRLAGAARAVRRGLRQPHQGRVGGGLRRHRRVRRAGALALPRPPGTRTTPPRGVFVDVGGVVQPAPAPRFGRTAADQPAPPLRPGADTDDVLSGLGLDQAEITDLRASGVVA